MRIERLSGAQLVERGDGLIAELMALSASLAEAPHWPRTVWEQMAAAMDKSNEQAGRALWGAFEGERLTGFLLCGYVACEAEVESIAVSAAQQRKGTGRALIAAGIEELRRAGVREVHLEVRVSNVRAAEFYRALGFEESGRRAGYYSEPDEDAVLLRRELEVKS